MPAHKSFDVPEAPEVGPTFDLAGETFRCKGRAPAAVLNRYASATRISSDGTQVTQAPDIIAFVEGVLLTEEWVDGDDGEEGSWEPTDELTRWRALVADPRKQVPLAVIGEIVLWLGTEYTARPTKRSAR